ncbi:isocitrate/isopropylmalate family dehydrogenase [Nesterenkonia aerolata]|uniref:Isocitrate/isopropylmalate family dehydrogenase n=1 Tax=Nesterenkonia aerolata TaxID=3074079 RepID=A0ABU2DRB6_9MICC|nr:isocitrate/isopropylmalate family dehydrogenase [Nesterenkonia sp. LY-0111]MDR8019013.1 isocitrate/isopropylmalate family dehydrogenase [Nesterenkonia sp. LY-0111]
MTADSAPPPNGEKSEDQPSCERRPSIDIAVLAGDGIGPEVISAAEDVMEAVSARTPLGVGLRPRHVDYDADVYLKTGRLFDDALREELLSSQLILFGALGDPRVAPGILERGIILAMRTAFDQAVNVRPVRLYSGVESPVRGVNAENCDLVFIRENLEGAYTGGGSTTHRGTGHEVALQESVNTEPVIRRATRYALGLASRRRGHLTLCHKTNILTAAGDLWWRVLQDEARHFNDVDIDQVNADAMCLHLPYDPGRFDVVLTDNLFGDILTDLGAMVQGGIGLSASANLNLEGTAPSMVEGVHGSAPDIAGRGWASPFATILSLAMGLASLGHTEAGIAIESAVAAELSGGVPISGVGLPGGTAGAAERIADRIADGTAAPVPHSLLTALTPSHSSMG